MPIPTENDHEEALTDLNGLIKASFQLSVWLGKLTGDTRKQIASILFAKINLCALSIARLLPPDCTSGGGEKLERERFCDVSSIASLCCNLIEASNRLFYFSVEEIPVDEAKMRLNVYEYYGTWAHKEILKFLKGSLEVLKQLENEIARLRTELEKSASFQKLPKDVKRRILNGQQAQTVSHAQIAKQRGHDEDVFRADRQYLSSHIHSDAFSLVDLAMGKAGGPMTDETREALVAMVRRATDYLALTLLDMNALFPQFKMSEAGLNKARSFVARLR